MVINPINCWCCPYIETSQLICRANQLTGFYMTVTVVFNELTSQNSRKYILLPV